MRLGRKGGSELVRARALRDTYVDVKARQLSAPSDEFAALPRERVVNPQVRWCSNNVSVAAVEALLLC